MLLSFILTVDYDGLGTPSNRKVHSFTGSFFFKLGVTGSVYADRVHRAPKGAFLFYCCFKIFRLVPKKGQLTVAAADDLHATFLS